MQKILEPRSYTIHDYSSIYGLDRGDIGSMKHCDAAIKVEDLWVLVEATRQAEPADINKLDNTARFLSSSAPGFNPKKVVMVREVV